MGGEVMRKVLRRAFSLTELQSRRSHQRALRRCRSGAAGGSAVERLQQVVDVFVGPLHRRQAARVFARKGLGASRKSEMKRYSRISARSVVVPPPMISGRLLVGQGTLARPSPRCVERQQPLAHRLVECTGLRAVMEYIELRILAFGPMRFAFDLNLPDEWRDGLDGIRHGKEAHQRQARVRQACMNPLADGPDVGFSGSAASVLIA